MTVIIICKPDAVDALNEWLRKEWGATGQNVSVPIILESDDDGHGNDHYCKPQSYSNDRYLNDWPCCGLTAFFIKGQPFGNKESYVQFSKENGFKMLI